MRVIAALGFLVFLIAAPIHSAAERQAFPGLTAEGLDGGFVDIKDFRGRPVLINFWATWCGPCRMELPVIQKLYDRYNGKGLVVLPLTTDRTTSKVPKFLTDLKLSIPVYRATDEDQARLGISSIPTTILLDQEGKIVYAQAGYSQVFERQFGQMIEELLAKKS